MVLTLWDIAVSLHALCSLEKGFLLTTLARRFTVLSVITLLALFTIASEAQASAASLAEASLGETFCVAHTSENIDGWVGQGIAIAELPDSAFWHGVLKNQAWLESGWEPAPINLGDSNSALGQASQGLLQVIPLAWVSTSTGKAYPFSPCAFDPVINAAVRCELMAQGWWH